MSLGPTRTVRGGADKRPADCVRLPQHRRHAALHAHQEVLLRGLHLLNQSKQQTSRAMVLKSDASMTICSHAAALACGWCRARLYDMPLTKILGHSFKPTIGQT